MYPIKFTERTPKWRLCPAYHRIVHFVVFFFPLGSVIGGSKAATIAYHYISSETSYAESIYTSSNTFFSPFCVKAEHSTYLLRDSNLVNRFQKTIGESGTYLTAPSSRANLSPCINSTGFCFCLANFSMRAGSSRKSICVPTIIHGTPGQW